MVFLHMKLEALLNQPSALPVVPKVVHELIETFQRDDVSIDDIARRIATDPSLSAKLLRLANSAYYQTTRRIGSVDEAIVLLGFVSVRTLVLSAGLTQSYTQLAGLDLRAFWRYCLHTAAISKWLAKTQQLHADTAFTVGLMYAIGQLVMRSGMSEVCLELDAQAGPLDPRRADVEVARLGYSHADVGAALSERWKLPQTFAEAIRGVPDPLASVFSGPVFNDIAAVIHLAAWRARAHERKASVADMAVNWPGAVAAALGLDGPTVLREMPPLEELCAGLEELIQ